MKYENEEYGARYAHALKAAQNLASLAFYGLVDEPAIMPPALSEALNVPSEYLVLLPTGGDYPFRLEQAVRETRSDVLVVEPDETMQGTPTIYFTLFRCAGGKIHCHRALRLWVGFDRRVYLVPAPGGDDLGGDDPGPCFVIAKGVRLVDAPWTNEVERGLGLNHADALLQAPLALAVADDRHRWPR